MKDVAKIAVAACALGVCAMTASADNLITYVDHTWDGTGITPIGAQGPADDGFWDVRAFGNDASIFQNISSGAGTDDAHRLRTIANGVLDELTEYNVYVYWWSNGSQWNVSASLSNDAVLPNYDATSVESVAQLPIPADGNTYFSTDLTENPFTTAVMIGEGDRTLWQSHIGTITGTSDLTVFIDDTGTAASHNERVWYDGIGYQVVPEPGSMALCAMGLGLLGLVRRNRR